RVGLRARLGPSQAAACKLPTGPPPSPLTRTVARVECAVPRACSSVGRALESHSRGRRFDPCQVHRVVASEIAQPAPTGARDALSAKLRRGIAFAGGRASDGGRGRPMRHEEIDPLLAEQIAYYRALAPEYEHHAIPGGGETDLAVALHAFRPTGDVLELACGPGFWTEILVGHATSVTAVDAAPEMLARAKARV